MKEFEGVRSRLSCEKAYLLLLDSDEFTDRYNAKKCVLGSVVLIGME